MYSIEVEGRVKKIFSKLAKKDSKQLESINKKIVVDECVSVRVARYLEECGEEVIRISNGRPDNEILHLAQTNGAYIITRDKGFRDYQRALILTRREKPEWVYQELLRKKQSERE